MSDAGQVSEGSGGRRHAGRRAVLLCLALGTASALVFTLGLAYLWPLFLGPLILAAVLYLELGSFAATAWLGNLLVLYHSFRAPAAAATVREEVLGTALFFTAGLFLGRVQRRHRRAQAALAATSLYDRLTGLYNYGTFVDYLHNEVTKADRYGGELALIMLDLDHFKAFNDRHGHEAGNALLRRLGATLRHEVRDADVVARYGGEEFVVLMRGDEQRGYELAERLRRAVAATPAAGRGGAEVFVTLSAGVATYPGGAADESQLVRRADDALYESKRRGRDRVTIHRGVPVEERESLSA